MLFFMQLLFWVLKCSDNLCFVSGINKCQGALGERGEDLGCQRLPGLPRQERVHRQRGGRPRTCVRLPVEALWRWVHKHACRYFISQSHLVFVFWELHIIYNHTFLFFWRYPQLKTDSKIKTEWILRCRKETNNRNKTENNTIVTVKVASVLIKFRPEGKIIGIFWET